MIELTSAQRDQITIQNLNQFRLLSEVVNEEHGRLVIRKVSVDIPTDVLESQLIDFDHRLVEMGLKRVTVTDSKGEYEGRNYQYPDSKELDHFFREPEGVLLEENKSGMTTITFYGEENLKLLADLGLKFPGHELYATPKEKSMTDKYASKPTGPNEVG